MQLGSEVRGLEEKENENIIGTDQKKNVIVLTNHKKEKDH
jgi:hypothetical protein